MTSASAFLTLPAVAALTGAKLRTVRAWIAEGELRAVDICLRHGSSKPRLRVRPEDLDAFLDGRATMPAPRVRRTRRTADQVPDYFSGAATITPRPCSSPTWA